MLLAKIKENKVYFWKLITFFGVNLPPTDPLDPQILSLRGYDP